MMFVKPKHWIHYSLVLLALLLSPPAGWAQDSESEREDGSEPPTRRSRFDDFRKRMRHRGEGRRPRGGEELAATPIDRVLGGNPFQPRFDDYAELQEGEEDALRAFVKDRLPAPMRRKLEFFMRRNPEVFRQRAVPRLRQLKRVFDQDPELGQRMTRHLSNNYQMEEFRVMWQRNPEEREAIRQRVRERIAENYHIELEVLGARLEQWKANRDTHADQLYDLYLDPETNVSAAPEPIRQAIENVQSAESDKQRKRAERRLREMARKRIDKEIASAERTLNSRLDNEDAYVEKQSETKINAIQRGRGRP